MVTCLEATPVSTAPCQRCRAGGGFSVLAHSQLLAGLSLYPRPETFYGDRGPVPQLEGREILWTAQYLNHVWPRTVEAYQCQIKNHIHPALGAVKLDTLITPTIQSFYNSMSQSGGDKPGLSAKSIKNVHGILYKALQRAVTVGYLRFNPAGA